jgi:biotin carboxyl carrier protein
MKYIVRINNKDYEVEVEKGHANLVNTTEVAPAVLPVASVPAPTAAPANPASSAAKAVASVPAGHTAVNAPMPGTILKIFATPGQKIHKGDVLIILEAMKMENEISAHADGIVSQVRVAKGATVSTGDLLITIQ